MLNKNLVIIIMKFQMNLHESKYIHMLQSIATEEKNVCNCNNN